MLSSYIQNHNCLHCLMNKCINEKNSKTCLNKNKRVNKNEVQILSKYVNNPLLINDIENKIKKMNIKLKNYHNEDILKNGFMYTTCLFCLSKNNWNVCKNVKEGRFNTVILENGTQITYCYPELNNVKHRIQIGLHIDLKVENNKDILYKFIENKVDECKVDECKVNEKNIDNSYLNIVKNKNKNKNKNCKDKICENDIYENEICINEICENEICENEIYKELYKNYVQLKAEFNNLQNNKKNNKNIKEIAVNTQMNLLNIQINNLEHILINFNKNSNVIVEEQMDILLNNQIQVNFNKIF